MPNSRYSLQNISFTPIEFRPLEFKPVAFEGETIQPGTLSSALARGEERRKQAIDRAGVFENAVNQARELLHNDEKTNTWYREYAQRYKDAIDAAVQIGDYEGAFTTASQAATDFLSTKEFTTRSRYNQEYDNWKKSLDGLHLPSDYTRFWNETHQYNDDDLFDSNGEIIEGKRWDAPLPVGPIEWDAEVSKAAGYVAESVQGKESSSSRTTDYTSRSSGSSRITTSKDVDKIYENVRARFSTPMYQDKIDENYDFLVWSYNDKIAQRDKYAVGTPEYERYDYEAKRLISDAGSKEGAFPTRQEYEDYHINKSYANIKNSAYTNVRTGSESSRTDKDPTINPYDSRYTGPGSQAYDDANRKPDDTPVTPGAPVEQRLQRDPHRVYDDVTRGFNNRQTTDARQTING